MKVFRTDKAQVVEVRVGVILYDDGMPTAVAVGAPTTTDHDAAKVAHVKHDNNGRLLFFDETDTEIKPDTENRRVFVVSGLPMSD